MKEILKIRCQISISMKMVIISRKIHAKMKSFASPFVPEKTTVNFAKFLRTPFLQNNSRRLLLKCRHCKSDTREIDCLCCREVHAMLLALAKIPGKHLAIQLLWASAGLIVTRVSLMYLVDESSFWFLV